MKGIAALVVLCAFRTPAQQASVTHNVNLREAAHRRASIIETIPAGQHVEITGASRGSFYRVKAADGNEGWAWQKNISAGIPIEHTEAFKAAVRPRINDSDRAHTLVNEASGAKAKTCGQVSGWDACHQRFDAGCTDSTPNYDAYLDYLKNEIPDPATVLSSALRTLSSLDDFLEFDQQSQDVSLGKKPQTQFGA